MENLTILVRDIIENASLKVFSEQVIAQILEKPFLEKLGFVRFCEVVGSWFSLKNRLMPDNKKGHSFFSIHFREMKHRTNLEVIDDELHIAGRNILNHDYY